MKRGTFAVALGVLIALWAAPAFALLEPCDPAEDTEEIGATMMITFDSCFQDLGYTLGNPIPMTFDWIVTGDGTCTFDKVELRGKEYTPVSKRNSPANSSPAEGTVPMNIVEMGNGTSSGSVSFDVTFTRLHSGRNGDVAIGNGHYRVNLYCDTDGDSLDGTIVHLGVNLHVEDPQ